MEKQVTASGTKAHQRADAEWRVKPYSDWHRTLSSKLLMLDVDYVEWRYRNGELAAVGVMEVTRVDRGRTVDARYLDAITRRFEQRDLSPSSAQGGRGAQDQSLHRPVSPGLLSSGCATSPTAQVGRITLRSKWPSSCKNSDCRILQL
jgi:hypothetical protein